MKTLIALNPKVGDKVSYHDYDRVETYSLVEASWVGFWLDQEGYEFLCCKEDALDPKWSFAEPKTFGEMSKKERAELVVAKYVHDKEIQVLVDGEDWFPVDDPSWTSSSCYRIKPEDHAPIAFSNKCEGYKK